MAAQGTSCTKAHNPGDASTDEGKGLCDRHGNKADRGEEKRALSIESNNAPEGECVFLRSDRCPSSSPQQQLIPKSTCYSFFGVIFDKQGVISSVASFSLASDDCSCSGKMTEVAVIVTNVWSIMIMHGTDRNRNRI